MKDPLTLFDVDVAALRQTLQIARAAECRGHFLSGDWVDLAVALLVGGVEDPEVAELAGFDQRVSAWTVHPLASILYERYTVPAPDPDAAVGLMAGLMAADLRLVLPWSPIQ